MKNVMYERSILKGKIESGNVTTEDLETATAIAKASSAIEDRVAYAKIQRIIDSKYEE